MADAIECVRFATLRDFEGALRAGLVHVDVRASVVRVKRDADALLVDVACFVERPSGMPTERALGLIAYASWFQVLAPSRVASRPEVQDELLFVGPDEAMRAWLVRLLSWGAEGVRAARVGSDVYVLAQRSPAYLQLLAEEAQSDADVRAFAPVREGVFVELGFSHALANWIRAEGEYVLIDRTGRVRRVGTPTFERTVESVGIASLDKSEVAVAASAVAWLRTLEIRPRLTRALRERMPTLWWVQHDAVKQLDAWVRSAGEGALSHYEVQLLAREGLGVEGEHEVSVLVRGVRADADAAVPLQALELAPLESAPRLFAPVNKRLDPPLHEARVLAAIEGETTKRDVAYALWQDGETLRAQAFTQGAFAPLHAWTRIHLERAKGVLSTWANAMHVELEELDVLSTSEASTRVVEADEVDRTKRKRARAAKVRAAKGVTEAQPEGAVRAPATMPVQWALDALHAAPISAVEDEVLLRGLSLADVENGPALARMGASLRRAGGGDEREPMDALLLDAWRWIHAPRAAYSSEVAAHLESATEGVGRAALQALALDEHAPSSVRSALASELFERASQVPAPLLFLALRNLAEASGGDEVLLARMRDVLRPRLSLGLEVGVDLPSFLRRQPGQGSGLSQGQRGQVLAQFLGALEGMKRSASVLEAPWSKTLRWARWLVAIGYARLGLRKESEALQRSVLDVNDDALEAALAAVAHERWVVSLRGLPMALSIEALRRIDELDHFTRYKFDRILGALSLLGEANARDAFRAFSEGTDGNADLVLALAHAPDAEAQVALFDQQLASHTESHEHDLVLVEALLSLSVSSARSRIERVLARVTPRNAALALRVLSSLARSVRIWGDEAERDLLRNALIAMRQTQPVEGILEALGANADVLDVLLRRVDGSPATSFFTWLDDGLLGETVSADGRLAVLAKMAAIDPTRPSLDAEMQGALRRLTTAKGDARLKLVRASAHAVLAMEPARMSEGLDAIHACIRNTTDAYQTSTHLCLSVLAMVDAVVVPVSELTNPEGERVRWKSAHHLAAMLRQHGR